LIFPTILSKLRQRGVGILSGEVEDSYQDGSVSGKNKLNLDAVFELNSRIANGENISDIFDIAELIEVLWCCAWLDQEITARLILSAPG
jgi:hypothetical protein